MSTLPNETPHRGLERVLAALLHYGTAAACVAISIGLVMQWLGARGQGVINAGIAAFILLPVLRLVCMWIAFVRARDFRFAFITALVLTIMTVACVLGVLFSAHGH
ncbi:protein of unknown function DUF1634 [Chthoniobacter flavus Ellin428]|uniref:DUF1634 domain-containing protein n=1 Tax=Chthoniobacter flavus Ellin428 TaxID=497964 RepID=B4DB73_9BACT|nr:DUF1634 domain-containing protein [Chthoniobacter flavus]EDY16351.1 protein of unknown function DUF1634 [Chthoniobacter flavus Ellin428]TCO90235.1 uncharacterized protein DUF1634 [Chthoniobacter flavus]